MNRFKICICLFIAIIVAIISTFYNDYRVSALKLKESKRLASNMVNLGDYVYLKPTLETYKIAKEVTGMGFDQTIKTSEISLWRVIIKIEMTAI